MYLSIFFNDLLIEKGFTIIWGVVLGITALGVTTDDEGEVASSSRLIASISAP
jgi:hypothetical protein